MVATSLDGEDLTIESRPQPSRAPVLALLVGVFLVNLATMPASIYHGDPTAMRLSAAHLVASGRLGVPSSVIESKGFEKIRSARYFIENEERDRWFSKYGLLTTLLYVPPILAVHWIDGVVTSGPVMLLALNFYNIAFSLLIALYLYRLAALHSSLESSRWLFVLGVLYTTFLWNYLRAQNSEIFQVLFFTGFYYHLVRFRYECLANPSRIGAVSASAPAGSMHWLSALAYLAMLCLTKLVYVLLLPVACLACLWILASRAAGGGKSEEVSGSSAVASIWASRGDWNWRWIGGWIALPMALLCIAILAVQDYKYGSPLSTGYRVRRGESGFFAGSIASGLTGLLVHPQYSIFTHFPVLVIAVLGLQRFRREFPFAVIVAASSFGILLLAVSQFSDQYGDWRGGWGYGPRYLVFALPALSLSALSIFDRLRGADLRGLLIAAMLAIPLIYSTRLQTHVNALDFFAHYHVKNLFNTLREPVIDDYFSKRHVGRIDGDLLAYRDDWTPLPFAAAARAAAGDRQVAAIELQIRRYLESNYYWAARESSAAPPPDG